ncbi:MAG TPA: FHA domain-containing protein [Gemmataceae bacterium]|nr:FHA domain-containing protein [Gemmataceae bacterium]
MSDPRFNSIHLDANPRREQYRQARARLMGACGFQTLAFDRERLEEEDHGPHTLIASPDEKPVDLKFWLVDNDGMYALKPGLNSIGRMPDNDVVLADPSVSRRHCAIVVHQARGCEIHDTASKNGTFLNGKRINGPTRLACGDVIKMCDREIIFQTGETPPGADHPGHCPTIG